MLRLFGRREAPTWAIDEGTPVTEDYKERDNKFTGKIHSVTIDLKEMKAAPPEAEQQAVREARARRIVAE